MPSYAPLADLKALHHSRPGCPVVSSHRPGYQLTDPPIQRSLEGYPEDAGSVSAWTLYNGVLSADRAVDFARDPQIGKHRWVVTKVVEPVAVDIPLSTSGR
jgi:hypothetical protein